EQVLTSRCITDAEPGSDAFVLCRHHRPGALRRRRGISRAGLQCVDIHAVHGMTIDIPGAIRNFVYSIDGLRRERDSRPRSALARREERVLEEVVILAESPALGVGHCNWPRHRPDRIVGVKLPTLACGGGSERV